MAERDRAAIDVDLGCIPAKLDAHAERLRGERLVGFDQIHVVDRISGLFKNLAGRESGTDTHDGRIDAGGSARDKLRHRFHAQLLRFLCAHNDDRGGAVVDAGSVCGGHSTVLLKGGFELGQALGDNAGARELVRVEHNCVLFNLDRNRNDFIFKLAGLLSGFALLLAAGGKLVLHLAGDAVFLGNVFSSDAHVIVVERVGQRVVNHRVNKCAVAHTVAVTALRKRIRCAGHILHTTRDDDVGFTAGNQRRREVNALQTGTAEVVEGRGRNLDRDARMDCGLTRDVLSLGGLQNAAHKDLVDLLGLDTRAVERLLDDNCTELLDRDVGERAAELADCGAAGTG